MGLRKPSGVQGIESTPIAHKTSVLPAVLILPPLKIKFRKGFPNILNYVQTVKHMKCEHKELLFPKLAPLGCLSFHQLVQRNKNKLNFKRIPVYLAEKQK